MFRELKKKSEELQIVWAEVYAPGVPDTEGDFMDAVGIREMAYKFLRDGKQCAVDTNHDNNPVDGACVVESFVARKDDPDFIEGSWVVGIHVPDKTTWAAIKSGELNGFSMEALVSRYPAILEIDIPPVIKGETSEDSGHKHSFYVTYDAEGNFVGGRTDEAEDGHWHSIRRGTVTEKQQNHDHRFSFVEGLTPVA